ncbi:MAG: flagellar biosynthesis protein FlhB [Thermodesulfobacteriota bacterium]
MAEDRASRTERPTGRRLQQAREKGQVSKSMEVNTCLVLLTAAFTLFFAGPWMYRHLFELLRSVFTHLAQTSLEGQDLHAFLLDMLEKTALLAAPLMILISAVGVTGNLLQIGGPVLSTHPLQPQLSKIDPIAGLTRLFSTKSLVELGKSILKIAIIAATAYLTIRGEMDNLVHLGDLPPARIGYFTVALAFEIFLKTCWILVFLAVLDLAFQKWHFTRDMMMTKEEVKEELKQTEGDPLVRSRIRSVQRDLARKRMMARVPEADVVVTNPVHLAVALLYDAKKNDAPVVVAKGQALMAERIKQIAKENDVPVVEDKPLAQALFKAVEIGQEIPVLFYQAVAEILSYVYRLKGKVVHGG